MPRNAADGFDVEDDGVDVETDDAVSNEDSKAWPPVMERK